MKVRYRMDNDAKYLYLSKDGKDKICIYPYDSQYSHYVDLLDSEEYNDAGKTLISVRMFFPNGDIKIGFVHKDYITIENRDALFDGRFNSDKV